MHKEILYYISGKMTYIYSGESITEIEQREASICNEIIQLLDYEIPKSDEERQALSLAKQQLAENNIMAAFMTLKPVCTELYTKGHVWNMLFPNGFFRWLFNR